MKLKDLKIGQKFKFVNGNGKTWEKISDNGGVLEYNICRCVSDLPAKKLTGMMMIGIGSHYEHRMNKEADVVIV